MDSPGVGLSSRRRNSPHNSPNRKAIARTDVLGNDVFASPIRKVLQRVVISTSINEEERSLPSLGRGGPEKVVQSAGNVGSPNRNPTITVPHARGEEQVNNSGNWD